MKSRTTTGHARELTAAVPLVPRQVFITKGVGVHEKKLTSRELAMADAGVAALNMIKASSIIPPGCEFISLRQGREQLMMGQVTFAILAQASTNEPYKRISAAIGIAKPDDPDAFGFFTEIEEDQGFGKTAKQAGDEVMHLAISNLAMSWRARWKDSMFDPKKKTYRFKQKLVRVSNVAESVLGDEDGKHTTVFVAAVFIF